MAEAEVIAMPTAAQPAPKRTRKPAARKPARRVDPTAAERQRRVRERRKEATAQDERSATPSPAASILVASPRRIPWSVYPLAGTTIGLMAVSLTHLSDGVTQLTAIPAWQGWAMAVGIDCMLIAVALTLLTSTVDVKKDIATVAHALEIGTLGMSAYLNALAFTGGTFDLAHATQILFGCFVPAAISGATYILARLTRADSPSPA
jgi:hypothetical protein